MVNNPHGWKLLDGGQENDSHRATENTEHLSALSASVRGFRASVRDTGTALDRAVVGASGAPLSNKQKAEICAAAREAWAKAGRIGDFAAWRQAQQQIACGCAHLTACTQREFPLLMAHFAALNGRAGSAHRWAGRALGDPARQARAILRRTLGEVQDVIGSPAAYMASICRSRFKTTNLDSLSSRQIWNLVFDLRRNAQRRRRTGGKLSHRATESTEPLSDLCASVREGVSP